MGKSITEVQINAGYKSHRDPNPEKYREENKGLREQDNTTEKRGGVHGDGRA